MLRYPTYYSSCTVAVAAAVAMVVAGVVIESVPPKHFDPFAILPIHLHPLLLVATVSV
jgi:hypothetical protein